MSFSHCMYVLMLLRDMLYKKISRLYLSTSSVSPLPSISNLSVSTISIQSLSVLPLSYWLPLSSLYPSSHSKLTHTLSLFLFTLRGFAIFFFFLQKSQKKLKRSRSQSDLFFLNRPKIKFCVCTIRPCLAVHVAPQGVHACSILSRML